MEKLVESMNLFFDARKKETMDQVHALVADGREDDARSLRAKANIYDVFRTLLDVSAKQAKREKECCKELFAGQMERIPASWKKSLVLAKEHGDSEMVLIEEAKLSAVEEIGKRIQEL